MGIQNLSIESFKTQFRRGARPNLFFVRATAPAALQALGVEIPELTFEYFCKSAKLPSYKVGDIDVKYMGHTLPIAGDPAHDHEMPLVIINEEDFKVKNFIEKWVQLARHPLYGTSTTRDIYTGNIEITQMDGLGNPIRTVKLYDAYFKDSGDIELSWDNENQIEVFTAVVRYSYPADVSVIDLSATGIVKAVTG